MSQENNTTEKINLAEEHLALIKERRSTVAFSDQSISREQIKQLFDATRWAASCFNEQPWRFVVARKEDSALYKKVLNGINEHNQSWAQHAPVLILAFAKKTFSMNERPNQHSWHDVGLAVGNLSAQATAMDLHLHQMAGIVRDNIYKDFEIADDYEVVSAVALGYKKPIEEVPDELLGREKNERSRKDFSEFVFDEDWAKSSF